MQVRLDYGSAGLDVELGEVEVVSCTHAPPLPDPTSSIRSSLESPTGTAPLADLTRGRRSAVVVISDKTRPVPNGLVLPPILEGLEAGGIPPERIEILVGTGLHRPNTREELVEMTSEDLVSRYRFRNHHARKAAEHRHLGRTTRGTEVWIDKGYLDADFKVVTGLIEPHLMAGWSGGRKGVAPGLAGVETMKSAHGVDMLEDHIGPGILEGNPFHQDLLEIAQRAGMDFLVNVTVDRRRRLTGVFAGELEAAHEEGVRFLEAAVHTTVDRAAEVVVVSAGGYPLDGTFYQSVKGLIAALNVVRRGGRIILAAEMSEGTGSPEFHRLLAETTSPRDFMERLRSPGFFTIDQWMVQHLCQVLRKACVTLVTSGARKDVAGFFPGIACSPSVEAALADALTEYGPDARVIAIPEGPYVLATVRGRRLALGRAWMDDAA